MKKWLSVLGTGLTLVLVLIAVPQYANASQSATATMTLTVLANPDLEEVDVTAPDVPSVTNLISSTTDLRFTMAIVSEQNATLFLNGTEIGTVSNEDGTYSHTAGLAIGANEFTLYAQDEAGNDSNTLSFTITRTGAIVYVVGAGGGGSGSTSSSSSSSSDVSISDPNDEEETESTPSSGSSSSNNESSSDSSQEENSSTEDSNSENEESDAPEESNSNETTPTPAPPSSPSESTAEPEVNVEPEVEVTIENIDDLEPEEITQEAFMEILEAPIEIETFEENIKPIFEKDSDDDGITDALEYYLGTNPTKPTEVFEEPVDLLPMDGYTMTEDTLLVFGQSDQKGDVTIYARDENLESHKIARTEANQDTFAAIGLFPEAGTYTTMIEVKDKKGNINLSAHDTVTYDPETISTIPYLNLNINNQYSLNETFLRANLLFDFKEANRTKIEGQTVPMKQVMIVWSQDNQDVLTQTLSSPIDGSFTLKSPFPDKSDRITVAKAVVMDPISKQVSGVVETQFQAEHRGINFKIILQTVCLSLLFLFAGYKLGHTTIRKIY